MSKELSSRVFINNKNTNNSRNAEMGPPLSEHATFFSQETPR